MLALVPALCAGLHCPVGTVCSELIVIDLTLSVISWNLNQE